MAANSLISLAAELLSGQIRVVDLTQTLSPEFPQIALPPEFGQCWPFRMEEISRYDDRGPAWYWNNFSCGEHTGTHFDAPIHWVSGRDRAEQFDRLLCRCSIYRPGMRDRLLSRSESGSGFSAHRRSPAAMGSEVTAAFRRERGCSCAQIGRIVSIPSPIKTTMRPVSTPPDLRLTRSSSLLRRGTSWDSAQSRSVRTPARDTTSSRRIHVTTTCMARVDMGCSA